MTSVTLLGTAPDPMQSRRLAYVLAAALAATVCGTGPARALPNEQITELGADGKLAAKYTVDEDGLRDGGYAEFHPDGSIKTKTTYRHGKLSGKYVSYHRGGKPHVAADYKNGEREGKYVEKDEKGRVVVEATYVDGKVEGTYEEYADGELVSRQTWADGEPVEVDGVRPYPRSRDEIRSAIEAIFNSKDPLEDKQGDPEAWGRGEALRQLKIYRFLCGVPYEDLVLDDDMDRYADAGARLCERIGHLDHTPANPGMPEEEYKVGYIGTSRGNLYQGEEDIVAQVRGYMDDSDPSNIGRVGHRRWCLNPAMLKTGFGRSGRFGAMYAHDASRRGTPDVEYVAYPAPGWMPDYYFAPHYAWSVSLSQRRFSKPDPGKVKITVRAIGEDHVRRDPPIRLENVKVSIEGMGMPYCLIFRPQGISTEAGARYWVEITGLERGGKPATLQYVVGFFEL